jgi:hypothetical protein
MGTIERVIKHAKQIEATFEKSHFYPLQPKIVYCIFITSNAISKWSVVITNPNLYVMGTSPQTIQKNSTIYL